MLKCEYARVKATTTCDEPISSYTIQLIIYHLWGRPGFDMDRETQGACRGTAHLVNPTVTFLVANDDNYALAA